MGTPLPAVWSMNTNQLHVVETHPKSRSIQIAPHVSSTNMADVQALYRSMDRLCEVARSEADNYNETRDPVVLESLEQHMELLYRHVAAIPDANDSDVSSVGAAVVSIRGIRSILDNPVTERRDLPLSQGAVGRPRYGISQEQLEYLIDLRFTCPDIARLLGVSLRTIRRRMEEFGIAIRDRYSCISDSELDEEVEGIKVEYPNAGIKIITGT